MNFWGRGIAEKYTEGLVRFRSVFTRLAVFPGAVGLEQVRRRGFKYCGHGIDLVVNDWVQTLKEMMGMSRRAGLSCCGEGDDGDSFG